MYNSPTWFGAGSVCFVGDGGELKFVKSDGSGLVIPPNVRNIQGLNKATIEFRGDERLAEGISYEEKPPLDGNYWMRDIFLRCFAPCQGGFTRCVNLEGCSYYGRRQSDSEAESPSNIQWGFKDCSYLRYCSCDGSSKALGVWGSGNAFGFIDCSHLEYCHTSNFAADRGETYCLGYSGCTSLYGCTGSVTCERIADEPERVFEGAVFEGCTDLYQCSGESLTLVAGQQGWGPVFRGGSHFIRCFGFETVPKDFIFWGGEDDIDPYSCPAVVSNEFAPGMTLTKISEREYRWSATTLTRLSRV